MLEKPNIADFTITAALRDAYRIDAASLDFLPLGYDSYAGVYRAEAADGRVYFVKVRSDGVYPPSVSVPHALIEQGIDAVIAPIPTIMSALWVEIDDGWSMIVYPFVEGRSGIDAGLTDAQYVEYGAVLRRIHSTRLDADLAARVKREDFVPHRHWMSIVKRLHADVPHRAYENPYQRELSAFWREKYDDISVIVDRAERMGRALQSQSLDFVLCHADYHRGNVLIDGAGKLHIVDWDQPIYAPIERDLMFVLGWREGFFGTSEAQRALFFEGYGAVEVNALVLAYYRTEWIVQDMGGLGEQVMISDVGDETRADGLKWFKAQFASGDEVAVARSMDGVIGV
jgi:spectinomycin phosphotransferase